MEAKALFVIPHHDFQDEEYFYLKEKLEEAGIKTEVSSTHLAEAQGRFKKLVQPEFLIRDVRGADYDAFIFIGGDGVKNLYHDFEIQNLIRDTIIEKKVLVLINEAVPLLGYAGQIKGKKVTAQEHFKAELEGFGGYFSGKNVEQDADLITAYDERSLEELSRVVIKAIGWKKDHA